MIKLEKILVPVDFSDPSQKAVDYGVAVARRFDARVALAHIIPSLAAFNLAFPTDTYEIEKKAFADAKERLPQLIPEGLRNTLNVQTIVKGGDVRQETLAIVDDENIDLVVMGTHGRSALGHLILGSTTENLLRRLPVPILTVSHLDPKNEAHDGSVSIRRIVYATDLADSMKTGLRYSIELAKTFGAELTIVNVLEDLEAVGHTNAAARSMVRDNATQRMQEVLDEENLGNVRPTLSFIEDSEGGTHKTIVRFVENAKADLLVLNLHSKTFLERTMLGATAERVIRTATVPVLSLPAHTASRYMKSVEAAA